MEPIFRPTAKVLLVDGVNRVLLFRGFDPARPEAPPVWFSVGGGIDEGETLEQAAIREVLEETGLTVGDLGPVVLERRFHWTFKDVLYDQQETYFLVRTETFEPDPLRWTELEKETVMGHRWWSAAELRATEESVFPPGLADLLDPDGSPEPLS